MNIAGTYYSEDLETASMQLSLKDADSYLDMMSCVMKCFKIMCDECYMNNTECVTKYHSLP